MQNAKCEMQNAKCKLQSGHSMVTAGSLVSVSFDLDDPGYLKNE